MGHGLRYCPKGQSIGSAVLPRHLKVAIPSGQLVDGGFLSLSMACSTEKDPGFWRGGNSL
jgi:hypothetical protein